MAAISTEIYQVYKTHQRNAVKRDISFELTFEEWYSVWINSGKWEERGRGKGKYVMCRKNDIGPYAINNVYIDLGEINSSLARKGDTSSLNHREKIRDALVGKPKSQEHILKNKLGQLSRTKLTCIHCSKQISGSGNLKQHIANKHKEIE